MHMAIMRTVLACSLSLTSTVHSQLARTAGVRTQVVRTAAGGGGESRLDCWDLAGTECELEVVVRMAKAVAMASSSSGGAGGSGESERARARSHRIDEPGPDDFNSGLKFSRLAPIDLRSGQLLRKVRLGPACVKETFAQLGAWPCDTIVNPSLPSLLACLACAHQAAPRHAWRTH